MHQMELTRLLSPDGLACGNGLLGDQSSDGCQQPLRDCLQDAPSNCSSELVTIALLLALTLRCLDSDLLVVLLKCREVFAGLGELALLHTFPDVPVHKSALGIHEVKLVVDAGEDLGNSGAVGNHAASAHYLGQVTTWDHGGRLVVDAALKAGRAPIHKLNGALRLNRGNRGVDILGHHVPAVHHAAGHILAVARVALHKHGGRLEDRHRNLSHAQLLMVSLLCRDNGCVAREHEMDPGVGHEVCLELGNIHIEGAVEAQRGREGGDDLCEEAVQVRVSRPLDIKVTPAYIVERLVVVHDRHVRVLKEGMHTEHGVIRLDHGRSNLRTGPNREADFRLLAIIDRQALQHQTPKATPSAAANSVVDHEPLQARAIVRQLANAVQHQVDDLLTDSVMAASEVVCRILFPSDELFGMEQLAICSSSHLIYDGRLQVHHHATGHVLPGASLREKSVEGVVSTTDGLVARHLSVGLNAMLQAEQLPARIADLDAGLSDVDAESFAHGCYERCSEFEESWRGRISPGGQAGARFRGSASQCDRSTDLSQ